MEGECCGYDLRKYNLFDNSELDRRRPPHLENIVLKNWKRFEKLELSLPQKPVVIIGGNGSGKTQLIWSILVFLRGYNLIFTQSLNYDIQRFTLGSNLYELLVHPAFRNPAANYTSFVNYKSKGSEAIIIGTFSGSPPFSLSVKANGVFELYNLPNIKNESKVRFAFATASFLFENPKDERFGIRDILTTGQQNLRYLFSLLTKEHRRNIEERLLDLFGITKVIQGDFHGSTCAVMMTDRNGAELEISVLGAAVQKVFATDILFYSLTEVKEKLRIFLVEEPDSLLYPSLITKYISSLVVAASEANIQMIITSNSKSVIDCFPSSHRIVLSSLSPEIISFGEQSAEILSLTASVTSNKPVIFLDGASDITFVSAVFPSWVQRYQLISTNGRWDVCKFFIQNFAKPNELKVVFLQNREFFLPELVDNQSQMDAKEVGAPVVRWELPCIESYLIFNQLLLGDPLEMKAKCSNYLDDLANSTKYFLGVTQGLLKVIQVYGNQKIDIGHYWTEAILEIGKQTPNWEKVVQVIHGHTWFPGDKMKNSPLIFASASKFHSLVNKCLKITQDKVVDTLNKISPEE